MAARKTGRTKAPPKAVKVVKTPPPAVLARKDLPPIPPVIHTACGPFRVELVSKLIETDECYGRVSYRDRRIELDADMALPSAWATLWHEVVHAWLMEAGVSELPEATEEKVCDVLGSALVYHMIHGM